MTPTKNSALQKWYTLRSAKNVQRLLYDSDSLSWDFKVEFVPLRSDIPITLLCLIVGVGSISRMLVVLQKTNNVVMRCYFCKMPFNVGCHLCEVVFLIKGVHFL